MAQGQNDDKNDAFVLSSTQSLAFDFSLAAFADLKEQFGMFPILAWFVNVLEASMKVRRNFLLWSYRWGTARGLQRSEERLLWLALGSSLLTACQTECLADTDVRRIVLDASDDMAQQVLQNLTLQLVRVRTAMSANSEMAKMFRNKILAVGVTVGITAGQLLVNFVSEKMKDEEHW